jgi:hypothetical protein
LGILESGRVQVFFQKFSLQYEMCDSMPPYRVKETALRGYFNKIAKGILHSYTFFFGNYRQIDVILINAINNASSAASQIPLC